MNTSIQATTSLTTSASGVELIPKRLKSAFLLVGAERSEAQHCADRKCTVESHTHVGLRASAPTYANCNIVSTQRVQEPLRGIANWNYTLY